MVLTIANAIAVVASIGGFVLALVHLWQGSPIGTGDRRHQVRRAIVLSVISMVLLAFVSVRLRENVDTLMQTGSLESVSIGLNSVFYPVPYATPPYLTLDHRPTGSYGERVPRVLEQRPDGFAVQIEPDSHVYNWKATGRRAR